MKIFVANAGRSGSAFMAGVFRELTTVPSYHEPKPRCINIVMKEVNNDDISPDTEKVLDEKIARILKNSADGNYFESSQMFVKSMVWKVMEELSNVYCIYLYRDLYEVIQSYAGSMRGIYSLDWFLQPHWGRNLLKGQRTNKFFDFVAWNWHEVRARYEHWKDKFVKVWEFDFRNINRPEAYYEMFEHFRIEYRKVEFLPVHIWRNSGPKEKMSIDWNVEGFEWGFPTDTEDLRNG